MAGEWVVKRRRTGGRRWVRKLSGRKRERHATHRPAAPDADMQRFSWILNMKL